MNTFSSLGMGTRTIFFLSIFLLAIESVWSIDIHLNLGDDSVATAACCANGGAGTASDANCCNLRSAVAYCSQQESGNLDICNVQLLTETATLISASFGQLELGAGLANRMSVVGPGTITPESTNAGRLFYFDVNVTLPQASLSLSNLTVAGFGDGSDDGGAIWLSGEAAISLLFVAFQDNRGADGGSIWVSGNSRGMRLDSCVFLRSVASGSGGGIYVGKNVSGVIVRDSTFEDCMSNSDQSGGGGALYFYQNNYEVSFESSTFTNCSAESVGGALYFHQNNYDVSFESSNFTSCSAEKGGALLFESGNYGVRFESSTFTSCSAAEGSGGALLFYQNNYDVSFE